MTRQSPGACRNAVHRLNSEMRISNGMIESEKPPHVAAPENDRVILRRIYRAVGDSHIPAAVNVHAVAVGVDGESIEWSGNRRGCEDPEPPAFEDLESALGYARSTENLETTNCYVTGAYQLGSLHVDFFHVRTPAGASAIVLHDSKDVRARWVRGVEDGVLA